MPQTQLHLIRDASYTSVPSTDRRTSERAATVFTIGRIVADAIERPCMVRDISTGGMRVQMATPPCEGTRVIIEMRGLDPRPAIVRWVEGRNAGLSFDRECDLAEVFDARLRRSGRLARQPRFTIRHPISLLVDGAVVPARILDISVGGARLELEGSPSLALACGVTLKVGLNLDLAAAQICWIRGGACGVRFIRPISSVTLAHALEAVGR